MPTSIYRRSVAMLLAALTAITAIAISSNPAEARRYRGHHNGALAFGIATAVIAGIALSRHHRHHRRHYYSGYNDSYYYDDYPRYYYAPRRHHGRHFYNGNSQHRWGHRHHRKFRYGHTRHRRHW